MLIWSQTNTIFSQAKEESMATWFMLTSFFVYDGELELYVW